MPQTYDLVATDDCALIDGTAIPKGRRFRAPMPDAAILTYQHKARHATAADPPDEPPVSRRRYRRRDLQADS